MIRYTEVGPFQWYIQGQPGTSFIIAAANAALYCDKAPSDQIIEHAIKQFNEEEDQADILKLFGLTSMQETEVAHRAFNRGGIFKMTHPEHDTHYCFVLPDKDPTKVQVVNSCISVPVCIMSREDLRQYEPSLPYRTNWSW
jgi:hypothetical protein